MPGPEQNEAIDLLLQILDMLVDAWRLPAKASHEIKSELHTITDEVQGRIQTVCMNSTRTLAMADPTNTFIAVMAGAARDGGKMNLTPIIDELRTLPDDKQPTLTDGMTLLDYMQTCDSLIPTAAFVARTMNRIDMSKISVDFRPIAEGVRDAAEAARKEHTAFEYDFAKAMKERGEYLTGEHKVSIVDATLVRLVDAYNSGQPLNADDLLTYMDTHVELGHEFAASNTVLEYSSVGKKAKALDGDTKGIANRRVTLEAIEGFILAAKRRSFDPALLERVENALHDAKAEANEQNKTPILRLGGDAGDAEKTKAAADAFVAGLKAVYCDIDPNHTRGNAVFDFLNNKVCDPAGEYREIAETTADHKMPAPQTMNADQQSKIGFVLLYNAEHDVITKSIDTIVKDYAAKLDNTLANLINKHSVWRQSLEKIKRMCNGIMMGTLSYNIPGDSHRPYYTMKDLTSKMVFYHQNEELLKAKITQNSREKAKLAERAAVEGIKRDDQNDVGGSHTLGIMTPAEEAVAEAVQFSMSDLEEFINHTPELKAAYQKVVTGVDYSTVLTNAINGMAGGKPELYPAIADLLDQGRGPELYTYAVMSSLRDDNNGQNSAIAAANEEKRAMCAYVMSPEGRRQLEAFHGTQAVSNVVHGYAQVMGGNIIEPGVDRPLYQFEATTYSQACEKIAAMLKDGNREAAAMYASDIAHSAVMSAGNQNAQQFIQQASEAPVEDAGVISPAEDLAAVLIAAKVCEALTDEPQPQDSSETLDKAKADLAAKSELLAGKADAILHEAETPTLERSDSGVRQ